MAHQPHHHHGHDHAHDHAHQPLHAHSNSADHLDDADHGGRHHHHIPGSNRAFAIGVALNLAFVVTEVGFGLWTNSLALLADAGHNFGDVIGLLLAWGAMRLALVKPSTRYTYGLGSTTILAALTNSMLLILATGAIVWEATQRLSAPVAEPVAGGIVIGVALAGVVINGVTALLFMRGSEHDLNLRGAYLHMAADAAVSLGVAVVGGLMLLGGWLWLDSVVSIVIAIVILLGTWGLLRESAQLAMQAVPSAIDAIAVKNYLATLSGVAEVHDLHIWGMSTTETALTAHLLMPNGHPGDDFFAHVADELERRFRIGHPTLQIETGNAARPCALAPDHVL